MPPAADRVPWRWLAAGRASRSLVLVVVFVALLLDNMLLTVVGMACGSRRALRGVQLLRRSPVGAGRVPVQGEPWGGLGAGRLQDADIEPAPFSSAACRDRKWSKITN